MPGRGGTVRGCAGTSDPLACATPCNSYAPKPQGGDTRSQRIEARRDKVLAIWEAAKDITLDELRIELARAGLTVSNATLHRFFVRHGITRKKKPATRLSRTAPTS